MKRILSALLATAIAVALAGCGSTSSGAPTAAIPPTATPAAAQASVSTTIAKAASSVAANAKTAATDAQIAVNAVCTYYPLADGTFQAVVVGVSVSQDILDAEKTAVTGLDVLCSNPITDYASALKQVTATYLAVTASLRAANAAKVAAAATATKS